MEVHRVVERPDPVFTWIRDFHSEPSERNTLLILKSLHERPGFSSSQS